MSTGGVPRFNASVPANFRSLPSLDPVGIQASQQNLKELGNVFGSITQQTLKYLQSQVSTEALESGTVAGARSDFDPNGLPKAGTLAADNYRKGALQSYSASLEADLNARLTDIMAVSQRDPVKFKQLADTYITETSANMPEPVKTSYVLSAQAKVAPFVLQAQKAQLALQEQQQKDSFAAQVTIYENDMERLAGSDAPIDKVAYGNTLIKWKEAINNYPWYTPETRAAELRKLEIKAYEADVKGRFARIPEEQKDDWIADYLKTHPVGGEGNPLNAEQQSALVGEMLRMRNHEVMAQKLAQAEELAAQEAQRKITEFNYEQDILDGTFGTSESKLKLSMTTLEKDYKSGKLDLDQFLRIKGKYFDQLRDQAKKWEEGFRIQEMLGIGMKPDPYNSKDKEGVDQYFELTIGKRIAATLQKNPETNELSLFHREIGQFVQETGMVPSRIKSLVYGALRAGTVEQRIQAAQLVQTMLKANPAVIGDFNVDGVAIGERILDLKNGGHSDEQIAKILEAETGYSNQATIKYRDEQLKDKKLNPVYHAPEDFIRSKYSGFFGFNASEIEPTVMAGMVQNFKANYEAYYRNNPDPAKAADAAMKTLQNVYGITNIHGRQQVMRHPPEKYYGIRGLNDNRFLMKQLVKELKEVAPADFLERLKKEEQLQNINRTAGFAAAKTGKLTESATDDTGRILKSVRIISDWQTDREASGGAPSYGVVLIRKDGSTEILKDKNGNDIRWKPDNEPEKRRILDENRKKRAEQAAGPRTRTWSPGHFTPGFVAIGAGEQMANALTLAANGRRQEARAAIEKSLVKLNINQKGDFDPRLERNFANLYLQANQSFKAKYGFDIPIASAYRDPERNRRAGQQAMREGRPWGGDGSAHLSGKAIDIDERLLRQRGLTLEAVKPFLAKVGITNPHKNDPNHFVVTGKPRQTASPLMDSVLRLLEGLKI